MSPQERAGLVRLSPREIEQKLAEFLKKASRKQFALGTFDCGIWLADWCIEVGGPDPAVDMRGRYSSIEEAFALVGKKSLFSLVHKLFIQVGIMRARKPKVGDAAVIMVGDSHSCGAIVTSRGYAVLAAGGGISRLPRKSVHMVRAWSIVSKPIDA